MKKLKGSELMTKCCVVFKYCRSQLPRIFIAPPLSAAPAQARWQSFTCVHGCMQPAGSSEQLAVQSSMS